MHFGGRPQVDKTQTFLIPSTCLVAAMLSGAELGAFCKIELPQDPADFDSLVPVGRRKTHYLWKGPVRTTQGGERQKAAFSFVIHGSGGQWCAQKGFLSGLRRVSPAAPSLKKCLLFDGCFICRFYFLFSIFFEPLVSGLFVAGTRVCLLPDRRSKLQDYLLSPLFADLRAASRILTTIRLFAREERSLPGWRVPLRTSAR